MQGTNGRHMIGLEIQLKRFCVSPGHHAATESADGSVLCPDAYLNGYRSVARRLHFHVNGKWTNQNALLTYASKYLHEAEESARLQADTTDTNEIAVGLSPTSDRSAGFPQR